MASHPASAPPPPTPTRTALTLVADDAACVAAVRAGDERAFEALFKAYYTPLADYALGYVGDRDIADGVVLEVLSVVWDNRSTWAVRSTVRSYLFGAVRNRALNVLRTERRDRRRQEHIAREPSVPALGSPRLEFEGMTDVDARALAVDRALAALPRARRVVAELRWRHGLSYAEIAHALGVSVKSVENLLGRTLARLRKELTPTR